MSKAKLVSLETGAGKGGIYEDFPFQENFPFFTFLEDLDPSPDPTISVKTLTRSLPSQSHGLAVSTNHNPSSSSNILASRLRIIF
jgi:hypothetical protein